VAQFGVPALRRHAGRNPARRRRMVQNPSPVHSPQPGKPQVPAEGPGPAVLRRLRARRRRRVAGHRADQGALLRPLRQRPAALRRPRRAGPDVKCARHVVVSANGVSAATVIGARSSVSAPCIRPRCTGQTRSRCLRCGRWSTRRPQALRRVRREAVHQRGAGW